MQTQQFGQMKNRNCCETFQHQFFKVSNETGRLKTTPIFERPLLTSYLDTYNSFILDLEHQIYVWIGNKSNVEERNNALIIGQSFVKAFKKPKNTMVSIIQEEGENVHFMSFFDKSSKNQLPKFNQDHDKMIEGSPTAFERAKGDDDSFGLNSHNHKTFKN